MAGAASSVKFATSSDADSFYYNTDTMSAIYFAHLSGIVLYGNRRHSTDADG